jgi:hypothetical protein
MGKLEISKELSDKISKSLKIKQSDIIDGGANKPIVRNGEPPKKDSQLRQPSPRDSPIKKRYESPRQPSPRDSPIKKRYESPRQPSPRDSPIKKRYESPRPPAQRDYPIKNTPISYPKKSHRPNKANELNYLKISKIVFISSIVGGIGITLGLKIGTILFL